MATEHARGQQPPETLPFFWPDQAFDNHGVDNINLYNGDDGIVVPLGPAYTLGPSGYQFQLTAFHSVKFWHFSAGTCATNAQFAWIAGDPTIGVGWSFLPGYVVKRSPPGVAAFWEYYSPNGGVSQVNLNSSNPATTTDGSHLRITANPNVGSPTSYTVEFPDGSIQTFGHAYPPPVASPSSIDFSNLEYLEGAANRYGLTSIVDRFGNTLVSVAWSSTNPSEVSTVTLSPFSSSTISFNWTNYSGATGFTRRVLDYVVFPAPGGKQLKVKFSYVDGIFNRNSFDTSALNGCNPASPTQAKVPELSSIAFSDNPGSTASIIPFSYAMTYLAAPGNIVQKQGAINVMTLPNSGTVTYDYCVSGPMPCSVGSGCDPQGVRTPTHCDPTQAPEPGEDDEPQSPTNYHPPGQHFFDSSPGVATRTEFDPYANRSVTAYYDRDQFKGLLDGSPDDFLVIRRTSITAPGNDDSLGTATFVRRHYFKVDSGDPLNLRNAAGIELEREYFNGTDVTQPAIRTMITCYSNAGGCGYEDQFGQWIDYNFTTTGRTPPTAVVTWFGALPSGIDGGTCVSETVKCNGVTLSNYNSTAGRYKTTAATSTLPTNTARSTEIDWTPSTAVGHWCLDLFDHWYTWDGGGTSPPAGSDGDTIVRQDFKFESDGFLDEVDTWDSTLHQSVTQCFYQSTSGDGTVSDEYSKTFSSSTEPFGTLCPGSIPSTGTDSDSFGQHHTFTNLLPMQTYWRNGTSTIGWNSLDLVRDGTTGFISESHDPNYAANTNLKTGYTYDSMGRVIQIQPPGGGTVEWPTTFCYVPQLSGSTGLVIVKKIKQTPTLDPNSGTGICQRDDGTPGAGSGPILGQQLDGFGRVVRELRRNNKALSSGSYFETQDVWFDSAGHQKFLGEWRPCGTGSGATNINSCGVNQSTFTGPGKFFAYFDAFGRPGGAADVNGGNYASEVLIDRTDTRVSPSIPFSDSFQQAQTMCLNGTWSGSSCTGAIGGGNGAYSTTELDNLGRIIKVTEPNPSTGVLSTDSTTYSYDVLDQLGQVSQGSQTRIFSYSAFGFLTSEQTPENGQSGNATTTYSYGSLGNVLSKTDGNPTSTTYSYAYDAAARLTKVSAGTPEFLSNCYDGTGTCGDSSFPNFPGGSYPKARLTRRIGINNIPFQAAPVFDDFAYSDASGRLSTETTSIGMRGTDLTKNGFGVPVTQSWTFNALGAIATHVHPRPTGSATTLTVNDNIYTSGFLTNETATIQGGTIQQIAAANYHESGRLSDYTTGSASPNVKTTIAADSVLTARPLSFTSVTTGGTTLWTSGNYSYDGASSPKAIGSTDSFVYDGRSRITSATYTDTGGGTQGFAFDRYGNLTSKAGINPLTLTTDVGTNHLTSGIGAYDDRGNLTSFTSSAGTQTQYHDLLNRLYRTIDTSGTDFTYLYDGGGERVAKFPTGGGATRREFARLIIEARGDAFQGAAGNNYCPSDPFGDVACASNPNDGKYVYDMKYIGITSGCGSGNYCPESQTQRDQSSVFFLKGEHCAVNVAGCTWTPLLTCSQTHVFADVACPSQYADWVGYLYYEGVTVGCGGNNFCPTKPLGSWQMLAWASKITGWGGYNPLPRASIVTYRDEGARVTTEGVESGSLDASAVEAYQRDNIYLGTQLVSSAIWSGTNWTTVGYNFYAVDHLGSTRLVTDVGTNRLQKLKYWPFGEDGPGIGSDSGQRLKFDGMERDSENDHYFDHARTQDFNLGRFVSADRLWGFQSAAQSWNRYAYVRNQPSRLTDPWGFADTQSGCVTTWGPTGPTVECPTEPDWPSNARPNESDTPTWSSFATLGWRGFYEARADAAFGRGHLLAFTIDRIGANLPSIGTAVAAAAMIGPEAAVPVIGKMDDVEVAAEWAAHNVFQVDEPTVEANIEWLMNWASRAGTEFYLASEVVRDNLINEDGQLSRFGLELYILSRLGFQRFGDVLVRR
jgi:RHS repeat-associated protein